jgi:hypothetical protein
MMRKIHYYYDAAVKSHDGRYSVDYYCSNGKSRVWAGRFNGKSYKDVLTHVRNIVEKLNQPKPIFGQNGRFCQWLWFMKRIRN